MPLGVAFRLRTNARELMVLLHTGEDARAPSRYVIGSGVHEARASRLRLMNPAPYRSLNGELKGYSILMGASSPLSVYSPLHLRFFIVSASWRTNKNLKRPTSVRKPT